MPTASLFQDSCLGERVPASLSVLPVCLGSAAWETQPGAEVGAWG